MTHYTDRSRYECGQDCLRKLFWNYYFQKKGVVPVGEKVDLEFGKAVHSAIELANWPSDLVPPEFEPDRVTADGEPVNLEWNSIYHGLIGVFKADTLPRILGEYDWTHSELELTMELNSGIKWMTRLDGVLRRKADGKWFVLEAKTTGWPDILARTAPNNFQLLMEIEALRRHLNIPPTEMGGALLLTFNKGQSKRAYKADGYRRSSPFTYWYSRELASGEVQFRLDYAAGWNRVPTWNIPDWFELGMEHFREEFVGQVQLHPSIGFDEEKVKAVIRQVHGWENVRAMGQRINAWGDNPTDPSLDLFFPQRFKNCNNDGGFKRDCAYLPICNSPNVAKDPVKSGLYEWRMKNHPQEEEG